MDYKKIGRRIRKFRRAANLSQEQLAEKIEISPTHMSHIETGSTKLSLPVLVSLAEALQASTDSLLFDDTVADPDINDLLSSCSAEQLNALRTVLVATKAALDSYSR